MFDLIKKLFGGAVNTTLKGLEVVDLSTNVVRDVALASNVATTQMIGEMVEDEKDKLSFETGMTYRNTLLQELSK